MHEDILKLGFISLASSIRNNLSYASIVILAYAWLVSVNVLEPHFCQYDCDNHWKNRISHTQTFLYFTVKLNKDFLTVNILV